MLKTSLHFHSCLTSLKPEQQRGLKCGHDPADEALLCGQTGSQVHSGAARGQAGVAGEQQAGSTSIQCQSKTRHPDSGRVLIHLVSMVHLLFYGSLHSPLPSLPCLTLFELRGHIKTQETLRSIYAYLFGLVKLDH